MKIKNLLAILIAVIVLAACNTKSSTDYKFQDQPKLTVCKHVDTLLLKEAYYSFREDISSYYNNKGFEVGSLPYYHNGFVKYIQGRQGNNANYRLVASKHTLALAKRLKAIPELWEERDGAIHTNPKFSFYKCLTNRIEDFPTKSVIQKVYQLGKIPKKSMLKNYMNVIGLVHEDSDFAVFLALDTFYAELSGDETPRK